MTDKRYENLCDTLHGEKILYVAKKHMMFYIFEMSIPLFFMALGGVVGYFFSQNIIGLSIAGVLIVMGLLAFYKIRVDYHYDIVLVTDRRIIVRDSHIIGHTDHSVEYESITAVRPIQHGIGPALFGYGDIAIETKSVSTEKIYYKRMRNHKKVAHMITTYVDKYGLSVNNIQKT